jgi:FkbM family methyltransferase
MSYSLLKSVTKSAGIYPHARRLHRYLVGAERRQFAAECALYSQFLRPGDLCFDVGANYGYKTEVFHALGARVVAFEPQQDCCDEIRARTPDATVVCGAVGSATGTVPFFIDPHRTGSSVVQGWRQQIEDSTTVPMTTLAIEIERHGAPRFCKIDVEGFDLEVLRGLRSPVPALSFEFHRHRIPDALACLDELARFTPWTVNLTGAEMPAFISTAWMPPDEAVRFLTTEVPARPDCSWGDVFVKIDALGGRAAREA